MTGFVLAASCVILLVTAILVGTHYGNQSMPADEPREWARPTYEQRFVDSLQVLPDIASHPAKEPIEIDTSKPLEVKLKWAATGGRHQFHEYGERIESDPVTASAELPNGQIVKLLGVAVWIPSPGEKWGTFPVQWRDPISQDPIADPEALTLPAKRHLDPSRRRLLLAFHCSDTEADPVRWHFVSVFNAQTLTTITSGGSWGLTEDVMIYSVDLDLYHDAPLDIALPISYGPPESVVLSVADNDDSNPARLASGAAEASIIFSTDGDQSGSSSGGGGAYRTARFEWREVNGKRARQQSFSVLRTHPGIQARMMQWRLLPGDDRKWSSVHGNDGIFDMRYQVPMAEVNRVELRRFPELAHCVFHLAGVPELPKADNLLEIQTGAIRFRYSWDIDRFIERSTATRCSLPQTTWDEADFPLDFEQLTPGQLLKIIEERTGKSIPVDSRNHEIGSVPKKRSWLRFVPWLEKLLGL